MSDFSTPPGWYPDGDGWERRWDGNGWSQERRRTAEPTQVRPTSPPPAGPPPTSPPPAGPPAQASPATPPTQRPPQRQPQPQHQPQHQPPLPQQGPPPPGYGQGYGQVPSWGAPPPPSGPRRSRAGLWISLAVVLLVLVGAGVGVAVWQPWDDGDSTATEGGKDPEGGDADADADAAVQGDVDGDGLGDALYYVYYDYDNVKKVTATSNGNGFETSEVAVEPYTEPNEMYFDWDDDGVNEKLAWKFVSSGKQITFSSSDGDFPGEQTYTMSLSSLKEYGDITVQVVHGDFDGDGDQDLAIAGPNDKVVDVNVLLNDGAGTFTAPVLWLSIPNAVIDVTRIRAGDFDKDGDADIWAELPAERLDDKDYTEYYSGDRGYALLTSTGDKFELGAVNKSSVYQEAFLVGDVVGDGSTNIVGVETNSYDEEITVTVYDVSSGQLKPITGFTGTSTIGQRSLQGATLSDVDGDGKGDVVFVVKAYKEAKFTGVQVMRSTGSVFDSALVWTETPTCKDDSCRIEFVGSRRY